MYAITPSNGGSLLDDGGNSINSSGGDEPGGGTAVENVQDDVKVQSIKDL